jgi:ligand-binding sensor domain-containing protein/DNA-binding CsgD family transcriptional regulator
MKCFRILIILIFIYIVPINAQNPIGLAQITNFTKLDYKGGNQNWDIQQDKYGIMYFANNEGLLTYNGENWIIYPTPNKTVVRSVQIGNDDKVYVGAQDEIGYFFPDKMGVLKYTSLKNLIPKQQSSFSDVWNTVVLDDKVFFRTNTEILQYSHNKIKCYKPHTDWLYLTKVNQELFAQERTNTLLKFSNDQWQTVCQLPGKAIITSITEYSKDTLLVSTLRDGFFLLNNKKLIKKSTNLDKIYANIRINTVKAISNNLYVVGTGFNGCYIMDHGGKILQNFSDKQTLQKNFIRSLYLDKNKNIWLGLDDGISFIAYNSAIKQIYPDLSKQSSTYSVKVFNKLLYIGTADAVYSIPIIDTTSDLSEINGNFTEVNNTKSQVWNLSIVNNHLFLGNEEGGYVIEKNIAIQLFSFPGTWLFKPLPPFKNQENIIAGTYEGLNLITHLNNTFKSDGHLPGLFESLRFLTLDNEKNIIWASHPYHGVYKLTLSADAKSIQNVDLCTKNEGLPSALHNYVFTIKNRNVVATENGMYEYDFLKKKFYLSPYFFPMFKNSEIQYLNEDKDGNIWFIGNKKVGVIDFSHQTERGKFSVVYFPELTEKVLAGFENIYPLGEQNIFVGSNKGVFHINYEAYLKNKTKVNVLLNLVKVTGDKDSTIFGGYASKFKSNIPQNEIITLPNSFNSFHFEFSSTLFEQHRNIEYSYQLEGFDKKWSGWNSKSEKDYTNLSYGIYTFKVKSRNNLGNESGVISYTFEIKPAWYQTIWSYLAYFFALIGIIFYIFRLQQKKHRNAQIHLKYIHQLEMDRSENEITILKNEKLETEVNYKNKELATATMHLMQRGKLLAKIKEGLLHFSQETKPDEYFNEVSKVLKLINEAEKNDSDWDNFAVHFDKIHTNFLNILKTKFPDLSPTDLKMCAYLKINLTSKEIAQLMSITIRAVEVGRYRLRKKLNLPSNVNLFDYLVKITSDEDKA